MPDRNPERHAPHFVKSTVNEKIHRLIFVHLERVGMETEETRDIKGKRTNTIKTFRVNPCMSGRHAVRDTHSPIFKNSFIFEGTLSLVSAYSS